jgi:hypothetical protein
MVSESERFMVDLIEKGRTILMALADERALLKKGLGQPRKLAELSADLNKLRTQIERVRTSTPPPRRRPV